MFSNVSKLKKKFLFIQLTILESSIQKAEIQSLENVPIKKKEREC
jgi:hypothetical protein